VSSGKTTFEFTRYLQISGLEVALFQLDALRMCMIICISKS